MLSRLVFSIGKCVRRKPRILGGGANGFAVKGGALRTSPVGGVGEGARCGPLVDGKALLCGGTVPSAPYER